MPNIGRHYALDAVLIFLADTRCQLSGAADARDAIEGTCARLELAASWEDEVLTVNRLGSGQVSVDGRVTNMVSGSAQVGAVVQLGDFTGTITQ